MKSLLALLLALAPLASTRGAEAAPGAVSRQAEGNRLAYLGADDPFYPELGFPRFTTPQWIGEAGVDAVVILAVDDLRETAKYETYLRPVLERLKRIDGRAPASIMCNAVVAEDPQFAAWLAEGISLEVHTLTHPCPLLGKTDFAGAWQTFHGGVDALARIPGNRPVAFRMPCCDSMNSATPRFFAEIFPGVSDAGRFLAIDSSVMCLLTSRDTSLPRDLVLDAEGRERFRKYFPMELTPPRQRTFERFAGYIEDYPYPYVIGRGIWEFPCMVPSDWEAFNAHGARNPRTTEDWKAALDATVIKQGVMTMVLHPHGWSDPRQIVELVDHAVARHGERVRFLSFREALERLEKYALGGQSLRAEHGGDNGVRLLDVNGDGFMDVVSGNGKSRATRLWVDKDRAWREVPTPFAVDHRTAFGMIAGKTVMLAGGGRRAAARFDGERWVEAAELLAGWQEGSDALTLRDCDGDGSCELLVSKASATVVLAWNPGAQRWERAKFSLPDGVSLLNGEGRDNGVRFVDLNGDSFDDLLLSNAERYAIHLWTRTPKPNLGWTAGWSQLARAGQRTGAPGEPPAIVRAGPHRNNGAWFRDGHLVVQNEDTAKLDGVVDRRPFRELIAFDVPPPKTPEDSLRAMRVRPGFRVELVAAEPLVIDPIAFEWDARGRLWVVEMRDYPLGLDGRGQPGGVVTVLEDADGDGRYEKAVPFLTGIPFPTGVMPWRGGALIAAAPEIFYAEDTDGDGRADRRQLLFSGFTPGNQQHRMNGFEWGLDGWIYGANGDSGGTVISAQTRRAVSISGRDFRFRPDTGEFEAESGATQYGRRRDDWGNWFGNNNPTWLWHYPIPDRYLRRNPKLAVKSTRQVLANGPEPTRVFAISAQPLRFNQPQSLGHVTSACSPAPYRDALFGESFAASVFISEPVHNVVHREVLSRSGASFTSRRAEDEQDCEFLASEDVWFRPTMLKTGPDGALYVADMYRFVLEHPEWIAPETQVRLDLRAGDDKGRIYRVVPEGAPHRRTPDLSRMSTRDLVAALDSPSGWQRDTVQRLLFERRDLAAADALAGLATAATNPKVRIQALAALDTLGAARADSVAAALRDPDARVRLDALRVSESMAGSSASLQRAVLALEFDPDFAVRRQLAFTLGAWPSEESHAALGRMAEREGSDPQMRVAILSSVAPDSPLLARLRESSEKPRGAAAHAIPVLPPETRDRAKVIASYAGVSQLQPDAARGREVFQQSCASCHRFKGEGQELGPDLGMVAGKPDDWLLAAVFDPNQAVEVRYLARQVTRKDGAALFGIIAAESANNITLRLPGGAEEAILRTEVREVRTVEKSLMPEGLERVLQPQDVCDLFAYLRQP